MSEPLCYCKECVAQAELTSLRAEYERLRKALVRLRDCDWVVTPRDRMDAVRDIARAALAGEGK